VRETKIKLRHGDVIVINTLNGSVSMGYLRRFLAGGFQVGSWRPALLRFRDSRTDVCTAGSPLNPLLTKTLPPHRSIPPSRPAKRPKQQAHLQSNTLLHAVFGYEPLSERPGRLTALEKRAFRSPSSAASKQRTQDRKGQRAHKGF
jgi:hypothetical protein